MAQKPGRAMQAFAEHMGQVASAVADLAMGVRSLFIGLAMVARTMASHDPKAEKWMAHALMFTPVTLALVSGHAAWIQAVTLPLRWSGLLALSWRDAFQAASLFALTCLRLLLPEVGSKFFLAVLCTRDAELGRRVCGLPVVHGLREKAWQFCKIVAACTAAVGVLAAVAPVVVPVVAGLVASGALLSVPFVIALVLVVILASLAGGASYVYSCVRPFINLWSFDPIMAVIAFVVVSTGLLRTKHLYGTLKFASLIYYWSKLLVVELLAPYQQRLETGAWKAFSRRHVWRIVGFGLPIWALAEAAPFVAVSLLQVFHGAAAGGLLADLLLADKASNARDE